ncbi:[protein-PII] uridylyltransferase [Conchiformibius steedae]|uniref:[protein-PII] uridylyltransferase n=1 Tax=Conchiformibius steedae TaxID=153493 RepID=UPI0026ED8994|nr:[protein-PII] uridylyltransferase [Conchiformibius steedae]
MNDTLNARKTAAAEAYRRDRNPYAYFRACTLALQDRLADWWHTFFPDSGTLALLATGGFGRGEVYPHSDTDLAVVSPQPLSADEQERIAALVQTLWDQGFAPAVKSGSIEQLCQAAQTDLTADTAFLEARFLCGNPDTAAAFMRENARRRDTVGFIEGKLLEMDKRHARRGALMLEPDIKNGAGGLRDIHTMMWLAKVQGMSADFHDMVRRGVISRTEAGLLIYGYKTLARLRIDLHLAAGRAEEQLRFDLQTRLGLDAGASDAQSACEQIMALYYRAAKTVLQLNGILIPMLSGRVYSPWPRTTTRINDDYYTVDDRLAVRDLGAFAKQPERILEILEIWQSRRDLTGLAPKTLRAWWAAAQQSGKRLADNETNRRRFIGFFQHGTGLTALMRHLNLYGILAHYLPQWKPIVGLLQHDLFHIYPVDDHILTVLSHTRRLAMEEHAHELPFASALMRGFAPQYVLYLAALLHDIAKGRGGDHAELGAQDARQFALKHQLPAEHALLLEWLVAEHLLMSQTAQKTDFSDPEVLARFCARVGSRERLTALYLLTVADIRGTNPEIWNAWKAQLLERLYTAAARYLDGEQEQADIHTRLLDSLPETVRKRYRSLRSALGEACFARHDEAEMLWYVPLLIDDFESARVAVRPLADGETVQVLVFMPDGERLFTRLCRIIGGCGGDIVAARAYITAHGYILDTFTVRLPDAADARARSSLQNKLEAFVCRGESPTTRHVAKPRRRARHLPIVPRVYLTADERQNGWYHLEIIAVNRPFLLADITEVFARCQVSLRHAKISTMADRAEDSFLIFCPELADPMKQWAFVSALRQGLA